MDNDGQNYQTAKKWQNWQKWPIVVENGQTLPKCHNTPQNPKMHYNPICDHFLYRPGAHAKRCWKPRKASFRHFLAVASTPHPHSGVAPACPCTTGHPSPLPGLVKSTLHPHPVKQPPPPPGHRHTQAVLAATGLVGHEHYWFLDNGGDTAQRSDSSCQVLIPGLVDLCSVR